MNEGGVFASDQVNSVYKGGARLASQTYHIVRYQNSIPLDEAAAGGSAGCLLQIAQGLELTELFLAQFHGAGDVARLFPQGFADGGQAVPQLSALYRSF